MHTCTICTSHGLVVPAGRGDIPRSNSNELHHVRRCASAANETSVSLSRKGERVDDRAELLVCAHARDLLRHKLAEHGDHREAAVLQLLELFLLEDSRIVGLEAEEGGDLAGHLGVVLLRDGELMNANQRDDLSPASAWHSTDRRNATGDVVEVQVGRRREESVRRLDQLIGTNGHTQEGNHADTAVLDLHAPPAVEGRLVCAEAEGIKDLTLGGAAEDGVVDAADEVLDFHLDGRGARSGDAQGRRCIEGEGGRGEGQHRS
mmetsp:Transcript_43580/g.87209  ORF Transcript_43580/g.87209 Transcript_43580/m.87209 type:complete len:262 (-) Transcript_43580:8-793(-)